MDQYDYLSRDQLISLIRALGMARAGDRGPAPGNPEGLPEFGARAMRDFERSPSPMRIFDHETLRYLAVNDAAVEFYGYSREEFLALTLRDTRHPDELADQVASLEETKNSFRYGRPRRHVTKSGEVVVVELVTQDILFNGRGARLALTIDMTGRQRMQELLWQRQQEFESLAENLPDLIARFDREFRYRYANSAVEKTTGLDRGRIIGRTQVELGLPGDIVSVFDDSLTGVFATGEPHKLEFRLPLPSGERQFEAYHVPEVDAAGAIVSVLCVARDITDRKRIEHALRDTNEFLNGVIESSRDCIKVLDLEGRLQSMNGGGRRLLEVEDPAPLLNSRWLDFWRGPDHAAAIAALDAARGGGVGNFEGFCPTLKGTPRWWDVVVTPILHADGRPAKLLAVSRDITPRKRARDVQSRLAAIVNHSMDAVVSKDLDGIIRTWNPAAERLFGYGADEVVGRPVLMLIPPDRHKEEELIQEHIRNGVPVEPFESVRCRKDGTRVEVSLSISPIKDETGQVAGASMIARDITERKQSELALLRNAALAQLLESLARAANEALTPEAAMAACLERICHHGRWVLGRVELLDRGRPKETPGRSIWYRPDARRFEELVRITDSHVRSESGPFIGKVLRERTAVWIEDWRLMTGYRRWESVVRQGLRSAFAFPIVARGEVVAIIEVFGDEPRKPDPHILGAAESIASQLARIVEREWAYRANARMAAIVESSQDAVISREIDGTILSWNPAAEKLFGYSTAEAVGRNIEILYPPELKAEMIQRQKVLLEGRPIHGYETVRIAKDGRRIHVSTSPAVLRDSSGNIWGVSTIVRDITERKLAEQKLHQVQQHLQVAVQGGNVGLWDWDVQAGTVYFSPEWKRQLGYEDYEILNRIEEWESRVHPEDLARVSAVVRELFERPRSDYQQEYRMLHKSGEYRWILSGASVQIGVDRTVQRMFGCHVDITAQKQAEAERLDHAVRQRDALVREVHHRIKNNLQGVAGLLRQKLGKFPEAAPGIEEAIVQLQTVAVVYGLQGTRADGLLSLAEMVEAICESAEGLIGGRVDRTYEHKSQRPACVAGSEAVSVAVALNELVFNALKHQSAPAGKKRAQMVLCEMKDAAEIRITNRGRLPRSFNFSAGRAIGNGLSLVRTLLASPGASIKFSGGRDKVEVLLKLGPPLLAGRQTGFTRERGNEGTGREKAATAHTGRG